MSKPKARFLFRDILLNMMFLFVAIAIILLSHVNPPARNDEARPPGTLSVQIRWPDGHRGDVDVWIAAPGDDVVGFKRPKGEFIDLVRDDLGKVNDNLDLNFENLYSRGLPDGKYVVNLHYYRYAGPVAVKVEIMINGRTVHLSTVGLEFLNDEETVIRFWIKNAHIVKQDDIYEGILPF